MCCESYTRGLSSGVVAGSTRTSAEHTFVTTPAAQALCDKVLELRALNDTYRRTWARRNRYTRQAFSMRAASIRLWKLAQWMLFAGESHNTAARGQRLFEKAVLLRDAICGTLEGANPLYVTHPTWWRQLQSRARTLNTFLAHDLDAAVTAVIEDDDTPAPSKYYVLACAHAAVSETIEVMAGTPGTELLCEFVEDALSGGNVLSLIWEHVEHAVEEMTHDPLEAAEFLESKYDGVFSALTFLAQAYVSSPLLGGSRDHGARVEFVMTQLTRFFSLSGHEVTAIREGFESTASEAVVTEAEEILSQRANGMNLRTGAGRGVAIQSLFVLMSWMRVYHLVADERHGDESLLATAHWSLEVGIHGAEATRGTVLLLRRGAELVAVDGEGLTRFLRATWHIAEGLEHGVSFLEGIASVVNGARDISIWLETHDAYRGRRGAEEVGLPVAALIAWGLFSATVGSAVMTVGGAYLFLEELQHAYDEATQPMVAKIVLRQLRLLWNLQATDRPGHHQPLSERMAWRPLIQACYDAAVDEYLWWGLVRNDPSPHAVDEYRESVAADLRATRLFSDAEIGDLLAGSTGAGLDGHRMVGGLTVDEEE